MGDQQKPERQKITVFYFDGGQLMSKTFHTKAKSDEFVWSLPINKIVGISQGDIPWHG